MSANLATPLDGAERWHRYQVGRSYAVYRAKLTSLHRRRIWAYLTIFADGDVTAQGSTGYIRRFPSMADALAYIETQIEPKEKAQ